MLEKYLQGIGLSDKEVFLLEIISLIF